MIRASIAVAAAVLLLLVGLDTLRWDRRLTADDSRFAAFERREGLWEGGGVTARLLGLGDDLAYRRAVSMYTRSRPGEPIALDPRREALRLDAGRLLGAASKEDPEPRRRAQAAMLLALLAFGRGDLFTSAEERLQVIRGAVGNLQVALELDPENPDIKRNLELALFDAGAVLASGATDPGGTTDTGEQTGVGRTGTGY